MIVKHNQLGNGCIRAHGLHFCCHIGNCVIQQFEGFQVRFTIDNTYFAGGLVDDITPQTLQKAHATDHVARIPRAGFGQWSHAHLIQAERVCTVVLIHVVRRDNIFQAFAHLAELAINVLTVPCVCWFTIRTCRAFFYLSSGHILSTIIGVRVGLNHALVEQLVERFRRIHIAQVKKHLMPETCIQQMQHGVFNTANIQIHATGLAIATI